jgi:DNA-binding IclR family transcriptional regulator
VGKAIAANLDHNERERLLGPGLLPAATRRTIVHPTLIRQHLDRIAEVGFGFSNEEFLIGANGVASAFKVRESVTVAIGCVGAWNNPAISRSAEKVAEVAACLQSELTTSMRPPLAAR